MTNTETLQHRWEAVMMNNYGTPPVALASGDGAVVTDADGKSSISYDDYAIALVDELEKPQHIRARFTIGY